MWAAAKAAYKGAPRPLWAGPPTPGVLAHPAQVVILATPSWDPARQRQQIGEMAAALGPSVRAKPLIDVINGLTSWPALALP